MESFWDYFSEMAELGVISEDGAKIEFDFDDINLYGIGKPPLTLAELYKIYRSEGYSKESKQKGMGFISRKGIKSVQKKEKWYIPENCSLLYRHIIAEQLWKNDFSKIDFQEEHYENPFVLIELLRLWINPLFWQKPIKLDKVVVDGSAAVEQFCEHRVDSVGDAYVYISSHRILDFADNPKICKENDEENGAFCAIHDWSVIARGESFYVQSTLEGGRYSQNDLRKMEPYNATDLRRSLILIAKNRGGKRAVELLRMLQEEWPTIKSFQINLRFVNQDSIRQFEYALFHAFNDLLATWGEKQSNTSPKSEIHYHFDSHVDTVFGNVENLNINES